MWGVLVFESRKKLQIRRGWLANVQPRTTERGDSRGGNTNTPERGAERAAGRVGWSAVESPKKLHGRGVVGLWVLGVWAGLGLGVRGSRSEGSRGIAPPPPGDKPPCPPTTSRPVEGILPPSMRRMARIVPRGAPPVAFWAGVRSGGGTPNPALTHPSDNAGANPPDKGHFSVKTPLRYG